MMIKSYNHILQACLQNKWKYGKLPYSAKLWQGEILTDTDSSNIWRKIFWRVVTVFDYTPVNAKQFDGLNIDGLAGKRQKRQNSPPSKFCAIR